MGLSSKVSWFAIGFLSSKFRTEISRFLNKKSYSEERLNGMVEFLQSCERGERLTEGIWRNQLKGKVRGEDLDNYAKAFCHVSEAEKVSYYLNHISQLKKGNKSSAEILKEFSKRLFIYANRQRDCSRDFGEKLAA